MRSDGEKDYNKPVWDDTLVCFAFHYAVGVELFSQLLSVSGTDPHDVLSGGIVSASVFIPEYTVCAGGIAAQQGGQEYGFLL